MSDDIELLIDDPTDDTVRVEKPAAKAEEKPEAKQPERGSDVDEGILTLKQQLARSQQRERQLEQQAAQATQKAQAAEAYAGNTQYQAITNALTQNQERMALLKSELKAAHSIGDSDRIADLTEAMTDTKANIRDLERGKEYIEQRTRQPERREQPRTPEPEEDDGLSPAARSWIAKNPEVQTDPKANARMMAGHWSALAAGLEADTPEYFAHIDKAMGKADARPAEREREPQEERPVARYAAPVERDTGPRKVQFRMTPEMKEAAEMAGMSHEEYAKQYIRVHGIK